MQAQQGSRPTAKKPEARESGKDLKPSLDQKEAPAVSTDRGSAERVQLPPVCGNSHYVPPRGRETIAHVIAMLDYRDAKIRIDTAGRLGRIGEYFLRFEKLEENDPSRANAFANRSQILSALARRIDGETDAQVVCALQAAAKKIATKSEIQNFRDSQPARAGKLFGAEQE